MSKKKPHNKPGVELELGKGSRWSLRRFDLFDFVILGISGFVLYEVMSQFDGPKVQRLVIGLLLTAVTFYLLKRIWRG